MEQLNQFRWPNRFYFVGAILLVELMTHAANAASYEVVPSFTPKMASSAAVMRYYANIFDHAHGKAYSCWVDRTLEPAASLSYRCHDLAKEHTSLLPPSSDITTAVDSSGRPNSRVAVDGLWQINSNTGDLQFCLAHEGNNGHLPPNSCIKIDWKGAPPLP
jgi:hypothetical protein